jgi:hypothetical protein
LVAHAARPQATTPLPATAGRSYPVAAVKLSALLSL